MQLDEPEWKICKHRFTVDQKSSRDSGADGTVRSATGVKVWYQDIICLSVRFDCAKFGNEALLAS